MNISSTFSFVSLSNCHWDCPKILLYIIYKVTYTKCYNKSYTTNFAKLMNINVQLSFRLLKILEKKYI